MRRRHWSDDPYWNEALDRYAAKRQRRRKIVINLEAVEETIFSGDGPAYRLMEVMNELKADEDEALSGYRGAPRLVQALLQILSELPNKTEETGRDNAR